MRTPTRMMSHIFIENIFMSPFPFPRFEIPKMNGFRANTDSSSTIIIIGGYSLLESSLHPAPVSLWLDFRYKEKKKRIEKGDDGNIERGSDSERNTKTIEFTIFCFTVYFYSAKKFVFSSKQFSRNYRQKHKQNKFSTVQFVLVPITSSTSCVRFDFQGSYFSQYSLYALKKPRKQMAENIANTRQFLSHAPIFKLRHLMDRNLTQLIHLFHLLQTNIDNNKNSNSNSNNDSNSNIILSPQYSIIERVFQNDGECIVIRFSTLIDRKKRVIIRLFLNNSIFCKGNNEGKPNNMSECRTDCVIRGEHDKNSINSNENNTNGDIGNNNNIYDVTIGIRNHNSTVQKDNNRNHTVCNVSIEISICTVQNETRTVSNDDDSNNDNNSNSSIVLFLYYSIIGHAGDNYNKNTRLEILQSLSGLIVKRQMQSLSGLTVKRQINYNADNNASIPIIQVQLKYIRNNNICVRTVLLRLSDRTVRKASIQVLSNDLDKKITSKKIIIK